MQKKTPPRNEAALVLVGKASGLLNDCTRDASAGAADRLAHMVVAAFMNDDCAAIIVHDIR